MPASAGPYNQVENYWSTSNGGNGGRYNSTAVRLQPDGSFRNHVVVVNGGGGGSVRGNMYHNSNHSPEEAYMNHNSQEEMTGTGG